MGYSAVCTKTLKGLGQLKISKKIFLFFKKIFEKTKWKRQKIIPGLPELVHPKSCHSIPIPFLNPLWPLCTVRSSYSGHATPKRRLSRGPLMNLLFWWHSCKYKGFIFSKLTLIWQFKLLPSRNINISLFLTHWTSAFISFTVHAPL